MRRWEMLSYFGKFLLVCLTTSLLVTGPSDLTTSYSRLLFTVQTPNATVEFDMELDVETGKAKALNVTAPGNQPIELPQRRPGEQRSNKNGSFGNAATSKLKPRRSKKKETPPPELPFHTILNDSVRGKIKAAGIDLDSKGTVDVAAGDVRIKLGLGRYAGLAHKDGIIAEGSYDCDQDGVVSLCWARAIRLQDGAWESYNPEGLLSLLELTDGKLLSQCVQ